MIGILANVAMRYTHWSTRICIAPVSHVKDRSIGALPDTWIKTEQCGARLSDLPKRNAMEYSEDIMVDRLLRLDVGETPDLMQTTPDFFSNTLRDSGDWGMLPRRPSQLSSSPVSPRRITMPSSPSTPTQQDHDVPMKSPESNRGPGPVTPVPGQPEPNLPKALRPGLPTALVPGSIIGVKVPSEPSLSGTPSRLPPLPPSHSTTPLETPEGPRTASPVDDVEMSGT